MTFVQVPLSTALASLPTWVWPTITALHYQDVEVSCWVKNGQWILRGQFEKEMCATEPALSLTAYNVDELWHLVQALIHKRLYRSQPQRW